MGRFDESTARDYGGGPEVPLISSAGSFFELRNRPRRDVSWLIAYLVFLAASIAGGIFAFIHRNTRYGELASPDTWTDPKLCPVGSNHATRRLLQSPDDPDAPPPSFDIGLFAKAAGAWIGASVGGSVLVGLLFVWLVRVSPAGLVGAALGLQVAVPAAMGAVSIAQGATVPGLVLLGFAGLTIILFLLWRPQVELVTRLLGLAGRGLSANPGLVPMALFLQVFLLALLELPLLLASVAAYMNGSVAYNSQRADGGAATTPEQCVDADGDQVLCCTWQVEPWVPGYLGLVGVAMTWSMFLAFQVKMFTVAGATAMWYFEPRQQQQQEAAGGGRGRAGRSRTLTCLGFAAGSSLGSLCCGSAVLTAVAMIRQAMQKARQERDRNLLFACAAACLGLLLSLVEYVTRFATVRAAITGEAFFAAGRNVVALLSRNAMDAFGVWWLPPMILQSCSFIVSLCWAVAVAWISYATTWSHQQPAPGTPAAAAGNQAAASAALTAVFAFLAAWAVLGFLASLLLNIIDSLFVCFALDRDAGQVSSVEVHAVLVKLPTVGAVVQQPDGGIAYGAAAATAPPPEQHYPPRGYDTRV
ncbi:hypothetical protein HYH02_002499 [Chlamydomonas schloesseri]|uniref:Choline transporter-like protein n=1 Tax=Chlamydomonas schloesseri TaxID=2026947 RepID=A0A835WT07_9CHLO|nr:hypothetical protein HYH02_002499 [Chlamydomonas schloesseri]|eukprot:KAG2453175.1 hypothetical protein HYH02_002499 [Chlamydomonas schloesseri]